MQWTHEPPPNLKLDPPHSDHAVCVMKIPSKHMHYTCVSHVCHLQVWNFFVHGQHTGTQMVGYRCSSNCEIALYLNCETLKTFDSDLHTCLFYMFIPILTKVTCTSYIYLSL